MPEKLLNRIPTSTAVVFFNLLESVVEIGLVHMYGADTEGPLEFASTAVQILESHGVDVPSSNEVLGPTDKRSAGWGEPLPERCYERARRWCRERLGVAT